MTPLHCSHGLRRQTLVEALLAQIFQNKLQAGQHLVTQTLAASFGVSHTPIREALIWLAGVGIVELLPNRGAVVRAVTPREVREICHVRRLLECSAVKRACGHIAESVLDDLSQELLALIRDLSALAPRISDLTSFIPRARAIDTQLHDVIAHSCGNTFLAQELERLKTLFRAFRDQSYLQHETQKERRRKLLLIREAQEHLAIVVGLRANNPMRATHAMARHVRSGIREWSRAMKSSASHPE